MLRRLFEKVQRHKVDPSFSYSLAAMLRPNLVLSGIELFGGILEGKPEGRVPFRKLHGYIPDTATDITYGGSFFQPIPREI